LSGGSADPPIHESSTITLRVLDRWTLFTVGAVGVWMVWAAERYTVFDDEAFSCQRYVLPMGEMVSALWHGVEPDPPLYYALQNISVRIFGVGPLGLRALSILMFLAGLVAIRTAAEAWFDRPTGIATLVLCALHPAHLFFGFAARWYSTMFFAVAVLLWLTQRLESVEPANSRFRGLDLPCTMGWSLTAAAVCYTNYFGPVVVGLVWLVSILRSRNRRQWVVAAVLAILIFSPWLPPFWRQVQSFPQTGGAWTSYVATAARSIMALLAGNLASHRAAYVWTPMALFCICACALLVREWRRVWPIAVITLGCFAAGVASRTMIDKYVMTFSGPAAMLVGALLVGGWKSPHLIVRRAARVAVAALALAWAGCGYNLVTERSWSSLRWLDPFDAVTRECIYEQGGPFSICTHPSARYYFAVNGSRMPMRLLIGNQETGEIHHKLEQPPRFRWPTAEIFRMTALEGRDTYVSIADRCSPGSAAMFIRTGRLPAIFTIDTSEFADYPEWQELRELLAEKYELVREEKHLEDPDAEWKDRLDPTFNHPRWRIVVRKWCPK
jgi:4-amino-4-deoxy-L-arabinose transferase-like glycosyltransferase